MAHIVPTKVNAVTLVSLLVLTVVTVLTAKFVDLGDYNLHLAMFISCFKSGIVLSWFMHLKYDGHINRVYALCGFAFLFIFFGFSYLDLFFR